MRRKRIGKRLFSLLVTVLLTGTMPFSSLPVMAGTADVVQEREITELDKDTNATIEATTEGTPEVTTAVTTEEAEATTGAPEATTVEEIEVTTESAETTTAAEATTVTEEATEVTTSETSTTTEDAATEVPESGDIDPAKEDDGDEESLIKGRSANGQSFNLDGDFHSSAQLAVNSPMYSSIALMEAGTGGKVRYDDQGLSVFPCGSGKLHFTVKADEGYRLVDLIATVKGANTDNKNAFYQVTKQDDTSAEVTFVHPDVDLEWLTYKNHQHGLIGSPTLEISVEAVFEKIPEAKKSLCIGTKFESEESAGRVAAYKYQNDSWESIGSVGFECEEKDFIDLTSSVDIGTRIKLEAIPAPGSSFTGWGGLTDELQSVMQESTIEFTMPKNDLKLIAGFSNAEINESGKMTYINGDKTKAKTVIFESFDKVLYQSKVEVTAETGGYVSYSGDDNAIFGCGTGELKFKVFADEGYEFDRFVYDKSGVVNENYKEDDFFEGNKPNNKNGEVTVKHNKTLLTEGRFHNHHHGCLDPDVLNLKVTAKFKKVSQDVLVQINYLSGTESIYEAYHSGTIQVDSSKNSISYKELKSLVNGIDKAMRAEIVKEDQTYFVKNLPEDDGIQYSIENGKIIINLQYSKVEKPLLHPVQVVVKYIDGQGVEIPDSKSYTEQVNVEKLETGYTYKELQKMYQGFDSAIKDEIENQKSGEVYVLTQKPGADTRFEVEGSTITVVLNYKLQYNVRVIFDYLNENNEAIIGYGEGFVMRVDSSQEQYSYNSIEELLGNEQWSEAVLTQFSSKDNKYYKLLKQPAAEDAFSTKMINGKRTITIPLIYGEVKQTETLKVNVQYQNEQGQALTEHPAKDFELQVEQLKDTYTYKDLKDLNNEDLKKAVVNELTVGGKTYELTKALTDDQVFTYENGQVTLILQYKEKSTGGGNTGGGNTGGGNTGGGGTTPSNPDNNGNVTPPANDNNDVIVDDDEVPLAPGTDDTDDGINEDDVTVEDEDVPLAEQPDKDAKDKVSKDKVSKNKDNNEVIVEDDNVPLANLPKTGDVSNHFGAVALPAGLLMVLQLLKRKDRTSKDIK